ncbi:hypothetical protein ACGF3G_50635 [Streptomyces sp. NPDC048179]|uniref:hypothetical protein n=1 Tax=Streptomyces sp. NPDC048179 TaxID=3365506 RepID=UPI0037148FAE
MTLRRGARSALLLPVAAVCALTSCGIPTTGVVQAGGPAVGIGPATRLYFVRDGALVGVRRGTDAPGDVESALRDLLRGPTDAELGKGLTTRLPLRAGLPTAVPAVPVTGGAASAVPEATGPADRVTVTVRDHGISVQLSVSASELGDPELAAAQLVCTAGAAQRVAAPDAEPDPVTVTAADGRRIGGASTRCPAT